MTTQTYKPHWEMHGFTGKQHLIIGHSERTDLTWWYTACGFAGLSSNWVKGNYERGVDRCRSCDRSAS